MGAGKTILIGAIIATEFAMALEYPVGPFVQNALVFKAGQSPALCLVNTSDDTLTKKAEIDAFNRLNDPSAPHRVILLVNKGTEGWNCPSLFACALARKLKTSILINGRTRRVNSGSTMIPITSIQTPKSISLN